LYLVLSLWPCNCFTISSGEYSQLFTISYPRSNLDTAPSWDDLLILRFNSSSCLFKSCSLTYLSNAYFYLYLSFLLIIFSKFFFLCSSIKFLLTISYTILSAYLRLGGYLLASFSLLYSIFLLTVFQYSFSFSAV